MKSIVGASLLILLFAAVCVGGKRVIRAAKHAEKTGRYIVKLHSDTSHEIFQQTRENARMLSDDSTVYVENEGVYKFFVMDFPEESLDTVKDLESVEYLEEETILYSAQYETDSWALDRIDQKEGDLDDIYDPGPGRDGEGIDIYILDTGIRYDHLEFGRRAQYPGFDPVDDFEESFDYYYYDYEDVDLRKRRGEDCYGHGTAVASLAAGNHLGVAKKAIVYSVRVLNCFGTGYLGVIVNGIDLAVEAAKNSSRPSVINMSLGGPSSTTMNDAVEAATDAGVPVVAAAGNWNWDACYFTPASAPSAITVGGTAEGDRLYRNTNGGSCVDILAPGEDVLVANFTTENGTLFGSGTSFAAPIVSGVLAIYLQEKPFLDVQDLTQLLIDTSVKGVLDLSILSDFGLNETTPNRLVQVKDERCENATIGSKCKPAQSCHEVLQAEPDSESGDYWLRRATDSIMVYCKMEDINGKKGLMRLAEIDMSNTNSTCPGQLHLRTDPMRMCERASDAAGCSHAMFSTRGIPYTTVCGRINAIQFGGTNAFRPYQLNINRQPTIDDVYVDGVVLSRVNATGDRYHVWTFAAALDEEYRPGGRHACPCTNNQATTQWTVPPFIGEDYFCETGTVDKFEYGRYYVDDPLWDGDGCGPTSTCCSRGNYFCKTFEDVVSDDIELRLCGDEPRSTEDSPITLLELYVQ